MEFLEEKRIEFETAKLAKECGFEGITGAYWQDGVELILHKDSQINNNEFSSTFEAPTLSVLSQWIREVHRIFVRVNPHFQAELFRLNPKDINGGRGLVKEIMPYVDTCESHDQAKELGIIEALKLIKSSLS